MEYKCFKNFEEMYAFVRGKVKVIEPVEVEPSEEKAEPSDGKVEPEKRGRKKEEAKDGDIQAD